MLLSLGFSHMYECFFVQNSVIISISRIKVMYSSDFELSFWEIIEHNQQLLIDDLCCEELLSRFST